MIRRKRRTCCLASGRTRSKPASHVHARSKKAFARESGETSPVDAAVGLFPFWPMRRGTSAPRTASSHYDPQKAEGLLPRIRTEHGASHVHARSKKAFARESGETSPVDAVVGLFPFWPMRRGTSAPRTASSRYDPEKAEGLLPRIRTEHGASHVHVRSKKAFARESGETSPVGAVAGLFPFWPMRRGTSAPRTASSRYDPEKTQDLLLRIRTNTQQAMYTHVRRRRLQESLEKHHPLTQ